MRYFYLSIVGIVLCLNAVKSQQTHFSQFYTTSMYLNPSLAGIEKESKLTLNYRNHWPQIQNSFITQNVSVETNLSRFNNGLGVNVFRDQAGDGMLTVTSFSGVYAHEIKLSRDLYLRVGAKSGFVQKNVAWDKLVFEDMIDSRGGIVFNTHQKFGEAISYIDLSSGMFLYSDKYYGGFSVNHLNQAQAGLINKNGKSKLERNYTIHGGAKFLFNGNSGYSISPNVILSKQGNFTKFNAGAYVEANFLVLGLWYASSEAIVFIVGVKTKRFQIGYSYDLYASNVIGKSLGSHEISYVHKFKNTSGKTKRYRTSSCPKF
jgi:type IX secretion system PorP/SprF family membrane protein